MTMQVQAMLVYATLGALPTDAGRAGGSTAAMSHAQLAFPGQRSRARVGRPPALPSAATGTSPVCCSPTVRPCIWAWVFFNFLIIRTSHLGFCFKTILSSNAGGACREVGSR